ncbi:uncharacterized protein [Triticum aestivum]|uniref:uncharacterized protein n=1 Tax=Triticum aestivum TaxID=4565 RepID=UPI001D032295|nr:uncharacterized protein LOC123076747 [Triticum aestivum]
MAASSCAATTARKLGCGDDERERGHTATTEAASGAATTSVVAWSRVRDHNDSCVRRVHARAVTKLRELSWMQLLSVSACVFLSLIRVIHQHYDGTEDARTNRAAALNIFRGDGHGGLIGGDGDGELVGGHGEER